MPLQPQKAWPPTACRPDRLRNGSRCLCPTPRESCPPSRILRNYPSPQAIKHSRTNRLPNGTSLVAERFSLSEKSPQSPASATRSDGSAEPANGLTPARHDVAQVKPPSLHVNDVAGGQASCAPERGSIPELHVDRLLAGAQTPGTSMAQQTSGDSVFVRVSVSP